jgi:hypothetical protein
MHPLLRRRLWGFLAAAAGLAIAVAGIITDPDSASRAVDIQVGALLLLVGLVFSWWGFADEPEAGRRTLNTVTVVGIGGLVGAGAGWILGLITG